MRRPAAVLLIPALICPAQERVPEKPGPVFSVTSTLVQVDAIVTDSKGQHVTDLKAADFEILEDGVPQKITHLSYIRIAGPRPQAPSEVPSRRLRQEDVRRTIVLMVDDLGLSFESMAFVRYSLHKFVEKQMQPGDLVAVCRTASGAGALQQFTSDKRLLLSIIDGLRWNPRGRAGIRAFDLFGESGPLRPDDVRSSIRNGPASMEAASQAVSGQVPFDEHQRRIFTVGTLGAVSYIVGAMREMPGRKSIVLFSDGMALFNAIRGISVHQGADVDTERLDPNTEVVRAMRSLIDQANRAGTVIYTMHSTALQTLQASAADNVDLTGMNGQQRQQVLNEAAGVGERALEFQLEQQGLAYLAYQTGGFPYQNGNDLNWGLDRVLEDQQGYYLIGYKPTDKTFAQHHGSLSYHKIQVKVRRPGLRVRSRTGFFGETDEQSVPHYATAAEQLQAAMLSPFQSSGIHLRLTALYGEVPKIGPMVRNLLHIDGRDLNFSIAPDGSASADVAVLAVATGVGDIPIATMAREYKIQITSPHFDEAMKEGILYAIDVPVKKRGAYQIRVAIRETGTEKIGSASQFLEVPELNKGRMALTSVVLWDPTRPGESAHDIGLTAAKRQFLRGTDVAYGCVLEYGGKNTASTDVEATIRVFRDDTEVFSGPAKLGQIEGGLRTVSGTLRLAEVIRAGDYYLQVIARDRDQQKRVAVQWTDFQVLP